MKIVTSLIATSLLTATKAASYNFNSNGSDWPFLNIEGNKCGMNKHQSPIDLPWKGLKTVPFSNDNFQKMYTNQKENIEVAWNGHTSQIAVNKGGQDT